MYVNDLGMRHDVNNADTINSNSVNTSTSAKTAKEGTFPTAIQNAVESQLGKALDEDTETTVSVSEALERLKDDPEWEDVGTALSAMYKNQQRLQTQLNLLSAGYANGLGGLSSSSSLYGLGGSGISSYGSAASLLGSSIFADQLI